MTAGVTSIPACGTAARYHLRRLRPPPAAASIVRMRRLLLLALVACGALVTFSATALGHAYVVRTDPAADAKLPAPPSTISITFSEGVKVLNPDDVDVVDGSGANVAQTVGDQSDKRTLLIPLKAGIGEGTYTVRYQVLSEDSHVIRGILRFGVGPGELDPPFLGGSGTAGPSETGGWGTTSRLFEILGLGGLLGLLAFRPLVWAPAVARSGPPGPDRAAALGWMRDLFWVGFGVLAVGAMLAEGYLVVVQSASILGVSVGDALQDASGISQVLGDTRFGGLVQLRGALLFGLFAVGALVFVREYGSAVATRPAAARGGEVSTLAMVALVLAVIGVVSAQGHASVARVPALQVGANIVHLATVSVWVTGLLLVAVIHLRLRRVAPVDGPVIAARALARFSAVAMVAVALAVLTGVIRTLGELEDPSQLWTTGWGRSVLFKLALLCPVALLALSNRRIVTALRGVARPNAATLRRVRTIATAELVLSLAIVVIASVLVAQVPGTG